MSRQRRSEDGGPLRGFARMEPSKQRELARKGGELVPVSEPAPPLKLAPSS